MSKAISTQARVRSCAIRTKLWWRRKIANGLRMLPGVGKLLGLPRRRIRSVQAWTETARLQLDWIGRWKGPAYLTLCESRVSIRRLPRSVLKETPKVFRDERFHMHNELFLARLPNARIYAPFGLVATADGSVLEESTWGRRWLDYDPVMSAWATTLRKLEGNFYTLHGYGAEAFSHWTMESLSRLMGLARIPSDDVQFLIPHPRRPWHTESLEMLGIAPQRCVELDENVEVEVLYFPSYAGTGGHLHPAAVELSRSLLGLDGKQPLEGKRFFLKRGSVDRRLLVNEPEIISIAEDFGFVAIDPGRLSFREQVDTFSNSEYLVGLHGSALANFLFAPPGSKVMELRDPIYKETNFYALADVIGQEYWFVLGERVPTDGIDNVFWYGPAEDRAWHDLFVAPELFRQTLELMTS